MTTVHAAPEPQTPVPSDVRRPLWPLLAAGMVVVWVVGLVAVFGVVRPPALARIGDEPVVVPPASIAWMAWDDGARAPCVSIAHPDGTVTAQLHCPREGGELVAWTDEGLLLRSWAGNSEVVVVLDPATGEVRDRRPARASEREPGETFDVAYGDNVDGQLVVRTSEAPDRELWRVDAPSSYTIAGSARSPDGSTIALLDSTERLLVLPADGSAPPRVWADHATTWSVLVWAPTG